MLLTGQRLGEVQLPPTDKTEVDNIETLRDILSIQQQREVGHDEAKEVAASLIEFYQLLAEEVQNDPES
jgi:hypothetical protein